MINFAREEDGVVIVYTLEQLGEKFYPGFALPSGYYGDPSLGIYPIYDRDRPVNNDPKKKILTVTPVKIGDVYNSQYEIVDLTEEELEEATIEQWVKIRERRYLELANTDWVVTKTLETGTPVPTEWVTYRQALRDITDQTDPFNITWPIPPV